ncbi:MAG: FAD-dependent oxidoreductase [Acidobacteriota bacterium]|nr:FAD-dependent oxidoreductase [Acidobacteriota bacterium]
MGKPILLAIDDDTSVLEAVVQDLRRHYGPDYRIVRAASGAAALDICRQLKERKETVAMFLSDQRMPGMTGVELLQQAMPLFPEAKRVLLTAYADTEAAIRAINSAKIHYYLNKPWDPPEEKLYPVLDDLLEAWKAGYRPPFEGIRIVGVRWSPQDHAVRDFLARNRIPYQWLNPESSSEAGQLLHEKGLDDTRLPVVIFGDGTALVQPEIAELAAKAGLPTQAQEAYYDLVIVGAGPAGLAAGVYGASEGLKTLIVEGAAPGGQAGSSSKIENYLGFPDGLSGEELAKRAYLQATRLGAEFLTQHVTGVTTENQYHVVHMRDGSQVTCRVCLIATGVSYCKLEVEGADRLAGAGVYYGAAQTEAQACQNETVYVVGGANSAGQAAMHFARYARAVHMLVRAGSLEQSMSKYLIDQIAQTPNIVVETGTEVRAMCGGNRLESIRLSTPRGEETRPATSVFIFIGAAPKTDWLPACVERDERGFVLAGSELKARMKARWPLEREPFLLETSVPGIFVAGDVRHNSVKRCASAVGEGSIAIQFVHQYLASMRVS